MRARILLVVPALCGLVLLGGCFKRSKISETYVLDPVAARDAAPPSQTPEAVVGVLRVAVPGWIDRPQVTERTSTGQIHANEFARWGEPADLAVAGKIAQQPERLTRYRFAACNLGSFAHPCWNNLLGQDCRGISFGPVCNAAKRDNSRLANRCVSF
jgi:uncharacterized lipoprotein YmbA